MKRGIEISFQYDNADRLFLKITKKRGKLTLEEITDLLRYEEAQRYCGNYAVILNCSEATIDGNGVFFEENEKGSTLKKIGRVFLMLCDTVPDFSDSIILETKEEEQYENFIL